MTVTPVAVIPLRITGIGPPSHQNPSTRDISYDLDTPASTVGQMPMKPVELVAGQQIELRLTNSYPGNDAIRRA